MEVRAATPFAHAREPQASRKHGQLTICILQVKTTVTRANQLRFATQGQHAEGRADSMGSAQPCDLVQGAKCTSNTIKLPMARILPLP